VSTLVSEKAHGLRRTAGERGPNVRCMPADPATADLIPGPFPPDWAFVLQLRFGTPFASDRLCGRIEHVRSGQAGLFASLEEARAFMERVMAAAAVPPP
jgi:hypothetical protein